MFEQPVDEFRPGDAEDDADRPLTRSGIRAAWRSLWRRHAARFEGALWLVSALALGAAGFSYADATLYQSRHADMDFSASAPLSIPPDEGSGSDGSGSDLVFAPLPAGAPIARLEIPRLELEAIVAEGATRPVLRRAVGRLPHSSLPGEGGNIAIAGHRDTFFRPLENVVAGDVLILESAAGRDTYVVEWTAVVEPTDVEVVASTGYPALTLVTCYPFRYVGNAPQRFVVRARRMEDAIAGGSIPTADTAATGG